jgi:glutathione-independent formaldehyde dehydrogenase
MNMDSKESQSLIRRRPASRKLNGSATQLGCTPRLFAGNCHFAAAGRGLVLFQVGERSAAGWDMLSDIFPTGWHATELAGLKPGESVVIYGCGPVGLMAAHSALIKGASKVMVVDRHPDRLRLAQQIGAIAIDDKKACPVDQVLELTDGAGADRGCECVGYQCHDPAGHEVPNLVLNDLVKSVRATAGIGVVGVYVPEDPGAADELAKKGEIAFDFGNFFTKGLRMGTGQCNVKAYNCYLRDLIHNGRAKPSWIVSHELSLDDAAEAYQHFDARENGWTKVILHPAAARKAPARQRQHSEARSRQMAHAE